MSEPTTSTPAAPGPVPPVPPGPPTGRDRFWAWLHRLDVTRTDGWLGGVCAGIAARLRIDPAIVRGIVAVAAVLGFPMLLLYAIAWALLPDAGGRIHLRDLLRGQFDPAMIGIGILLVVSFVPVVPWLGSALFAPSWLFPGWSGWSPLAVLTTILGLALVVGVVFLVARSSRRAQTPGDSAPAPRQASADAGAPGSAAATVGSGAAAASSSGDEPVEPGAIEPPGPEPLAPERGAGNADIADWRARHDAWRARNDAWRRGQQDADRLAREQSRRERDAANAAFAAEAAERRRIDRLARPRTSFAFVAAVLGAALVVGAIAGLVTWTGADTASAARQGYASVGDRAFAGAVGLFAAALVVALAMVLAGALRRRSGFLAFVAVLLLVAGSVAAAAPPVTAEAASWNQYVTNQDRAQGTIVQRVGNLTVNLYPVAVGTPTPVVIQKGGGSTTIQVWAGVEVDLVGRVGASTQVYAQNWRDDGNVHHTDISPDGNGYISARLAYPGAAVVTRQSVRIDQDSGSIAIQVYSPALGDWSDTGPSASATPEATPNPSATTPAVTPSPTSVPTPEVNP